MYHSKHEKGYVTSHEVKNTHFRTWKSGKKWLYGSAALALTLAPISGALQPFLNQSNLAPIKVKAATAATATLNANNNLGYRQSQLFRNRICQYQQLQHLWISRNRWQLD